MRGDFGSAARSRLLRSLQIRPLATAFLAVGEHYKHGLKATISYSEDRTVVLGEEFGDALGIPCT